MTTMPPHLQQQEVRVAGYCSIDNAFIQKHKEIMDDDDTLQAIVSSLPDNTVSVSTGEVEAVTPVGFSYAASTTPGLSGGPVYVDSGLLGVHWGVTTTHGVFGPKDYPECTAMWCPELKHLMEAVVPDLCGGLALEG